VRGDGIEGFQVSRVSRGGGVMKLVEEALAKGRAVRHTYSVSEVPDVVL
jgi:hypothetical protein